MAHQKSPILLALLIIGLCALSGCISEPQTVIEAKGPVVTIRRAGTLPEFQNISLREIRRAENAASTIHVTLVESGSSYVEIVTHENLKDKLYCEVNNGTLEIKTTQPGYYAFSRLDITIAYPKGQLQSLRSYGDYTIRSKETLTAQKFTANIQSHGSLTMDIRADSLTVIATESSQVKLGGKAESLSLRSSDGALIDALNMKAVDASVNVRGTGDCLVNATGTLRIQMIGSGNVVYSGAPEVYKSQFGTGSIRQRSTQK